MKSRLYRDELNNTTDEHIRVEFLRLIAQEGRQHFMNQISEEETGESSEQNIVPLPVR